MKKFVWFASLLLLLPIAASAGIVEGFDDVANLGASGWALINNSDPLGTTGWFQGNPAVFAAQAGADGAYIAANFNNAGFGGNISNWLLTPVFSMGSPFRVVFWTRTEAGSIFPDSLEVRLSTNGASTNVGSTDTSVGDFSILVLTINPTLAVGGYPEGWTRVEFDASGLGPSVSGRVGFRYLVTDTSVNGDYIGIDTFSQTPVPEPLTLMTLGTGLLGIAVRRIRKDRV